MRRPRGLTLIEIIIVICVIIVLAVILVPNFWRAYEEGQYASCGQNIKNVATALNSYAVDHGHAYPRDLKTLVPAYLDTLPTCPSAGGTDTYQRGYTRADRPSNFTIYCNGEWHAAVGRSPNQPWYRHDEGLGP